MRLENTEGASQPFWSPDGREIAFFADGKLKKIPAGGGLAEILCKAEEFTNGGTWSRSGIILFSARDLLYAVPSTGGDVVQVLKLDKHRGELAQTWPQFLPDGRSFIFWSANSDARRHGEYIGSLNGAAPARLFTNKSRAAFAPPDYLLFIRDTILYAQRWDLQRKRPVAEPVPIASDVNETDNRSAFSISDNGALVYRTGAYKSFQITCVGRDGRTLKKVGPPERYLQIALSPDERMARSKYFGSGTAHEEVGASAVGYADLVGAEPGHGGLPFRSGLVGPMGGASSMPLIRSKEKRQN